MPIAVVLSLIVGYVATRTIVAESDAHRMGLPDRWRAPVCTTCGADLGATLTVCRPDRHAQRRRNAVVAAATMALMGTMPLAVPTLWVLPAYLAFTGFAVLLTVTDIDTKLIPNRILVRGLVVSGTPLVVGGLLAGDGGDVVRSIAGAGAYFAGMLALALVAGGALGFGDVKLALLLGSFVAYLGWWHLVIAGLGSFIVAGLAAIVLLVTRRATRKDAIPFGPFMVVAAFVAIYAGDAIIGWYG